MPRIPMKGDTDAYSVRDMIAEAQRELELREKHYPRFVRQGKLSGDESARRISLMRAIIRRLTQTAAM